MSDKEPLATALREVERLRRGITDYLDGTYANPRDGRAISPQQKCPHDRFYWEACGDCIDEHFTRLLSESKS